MNEEPVVAVVTTVSSQEEATVIADKAVSEGLAACGQISGPITSHYRWKGQFCRETEWKVTMKTFESLQTGLMVQIEEIHPYETPEIISIPVGSVSRAYRDWMSDTLRE